MRIVICKRKKMILLVVALLLCFAMGVHFMQPVLAVKTYITATEDSVQLPIIMYHSVVKDMKKASKYEIPVEVLEKDFVYLRQQGYNTIFMKDLIDFVYYHYPLPDKPILITFDDGYYNNLVYLKPLLEKYKMRAVISIVGNYIDRYSALDDKNLNYAMLDWDDVRELAQCEYVELQNHSYDLHAEKGRKGASRKKGETVEAYQKILENDLSKMQQLLKENCGIEATTFTYPLGQISPESEEVIKKMGFQASLSCYERMNTITSDPECLYQLNRYNRSGKISTEVFMKEKGL